MIKKFDLAIDENISFINTRFNKFRLEGPQSKNARDLKSNKFYYADQVTLYCISGNNNYMACLRVLDKGGAIGQTNNVFYKTCSNSHNYQSCYFDDFKKAEVFLANCVAHGITSCAKVEKVIRLQNERSFFKVGTICGDCLIQAYKLNEDEEGRLIGQSVADKITFHNALKIKYFFKDFGNPLIQAESIFGYSANSGLIDFISNQLFVKLDNKNAPFEGIPNAEDQGDQLWKRLIDLGNKNPLLREKYEQTFFEPLRIILCSFIGEGEQARNIEKLGNIEKIIFSDRNTQILDNGGREIAQDILNLLKHPYFKITGTYDHDKKLITIYLKNIREKENVIYALIHEFFHAIHFFYRDIKDPSNNNFVRNQCKIKIVVESLAAFYEKEFAKNNGNTDYQYQLEDTWERIPLPYFSYSGAKYIKDFNAFRDIVNVSLLSADKAYDMFIPKYIDFRLDFGINALTNNSIAHHSTTSIFHIDFNKINIPSFLPFPFLIMVVGGYLYALKKHQELDYLEDGDALSLIFYIIKQIPFSILNDFFESQLLVEFDDINTPHKGIKVDNLQLNVLLNKLKELQKSFTMSLDFNETFFLPLETIVLCLMGEGQQADKIEKMGDIKSIIFSDRNAKILDNGGRELAREIVDLIEHPFMKTLGAYNHKSKLITIYIKNIDDKRDVAFVFAHEIFHAVHYLLRDLKDSKHSSFIKDESKIDIVLESLASYFEKYYADQILGGNYYGDKLLWQWERHPLPYYPYSGAKYIKDFDEFKKIVDASLLSADAAYDMFIPKYINPKHDTGIKTKNPRSMPMTNSSIDFKNINERIVLIFATLLLCGNLKNTQIRNLQDLEFCKTKFGLDKYPVLIKRDIYFSLSEQSHYTSKEFLGYRIYTNWNKDALDKVFDYLKTIVTDWEND